MFSTLVRRADICVQVGDVDWRELRARSRIGVTDGLQYREGERETTTSRSHVHDRVRCARVAPDVTILGVASSW